MLVEQNAWLTCGVTDRAYVLQAGRVPLRRKSLALDSNTASQGTGKFQAVPAAQANRLPRPLIDQHDRLDFSLTITDSYCRPSQLDGFVIDTLKRSCHVASAWGYRQKDHADTMGQRMGWQSQ